GRNQPLIGRGKVADYIPALAERRAATSLVSRSVRWTVSTGRNQPLIGRGKVADYIPALAERRAATSLVSRS
ncbi:hypothetical protein CPA58_29615, partial [Klebsiella pneumoniae]